MREGYEGLLEEGVGKYYAPGEALMADASEIAAAAGGGDNGPPKEHKEHKDHRDLTKASKHLMGGTIILDIVWIMRYLRAEYTLAHTHTGGLCTVVHRKN